MSKKADKFIEKYIVGKDDWLLKHKEVISKLLDEYETEQLTIPVVSKSFFCITEEETGKQTECKKQCSYCRCK
tara:strand:- start:2894 stop:3112 length:219 start_codon:yes stop_codon:yes gene_type:complete